MESQFTVDYRHRSWNHICVRHNGELGLTMFYYNGELIGERKQQPDQSRIAVQGAPEFTRQFLVFGQEPDLFRGGFNALQAFQGGIAEFNWWGRELDETVIRSLAACWDGSKHAVGDVVAWQREDFEVKNVLLEEIDSLQFCRTRSFLFFPGRLNRREAETLCGSHGGGVAVPQTQAENELVTKLYTSNLIDCKDNSTGIIGWVGAIIKERETYSSFFGSILMKLNYTNYLGQ